MQIYNFNTAKFNGIKDKPIFENQFSKEIKITMQKDAFMKKRCTPNFIKM